MALACCLVLTTACSADRGPSQACPDPPPRGDLQPLTVEPLGQPTWTMRSREATFSSPKLIDLNGDDVLDVVQGFGQDTLGARASSLVATDGKTGRELWRSTGHEDLIGSASFGQLGGDSTPDVVIGGRRGALLAFDGANGDVLWAFDDQGGRWFNFYTSPIVDDQDGDGVDDVVAANGGLVIDEPAEGGGVPDPDERYRGTTFLISGADGTVIASLAAPDGREQYMSPVVVPATGGDGLDLMVGTGGETLPGSLWRLPLDGLVAEDAGAASQVISGGAKGIIAPPSLADLTGDCVLDVVAQSFGGTLTAIDGATNRPLWTVDNPGFETYSSPTLGYFVGDDAVVDVFVGLARGVWPEYESSDYVLVDGATGSVVWRATAGTFAPSGFVAGDLNGDGRDEVIFGVNDLQANTHRLHVLDTDRLELHPLSPALDQTTFAAPWLGDLDGNGRLDLIVSESAYQSSGPARTHRFELPWTAPETVTWAGYLGGSTGAVAGS